MSRVGTSRGCAAGTAALLLALTTVAGCSGDSDPGPAPTSSPAAPTTTPASTPTVSTPAAARSAAPSQPSARRVHPVSLPALFDKAYDGRDLTLRSTIATTDAYTSHSVTYRSNGLTISGKLDVPSGKGPFPALVLAHGYIEPSA